MSGPFVTPSTLRRTALGRKPQSAAVFPRARRGWPAKWRGRPVIRADDPSVGPTRVRSDRMSLHRTGIADPFRHAFDHAPVALALTGLDGRIQHANAALAALCGASANGLAGTSISALIDPADANEIAGALSWIAAGPGDEFV